MLEASIYMLIKWQYFTLLALVFHSLPSIIWKLFPLNDSWIFFSMMRLIMQDRSQDLITSIEGTYFCGSRNRTWGHPAPRGASPLPAEGSPMAQLCVNFEPPSTVSREANVGPLNPQGLWVFERGIGHTFRGQFLYPYFLCKVFALLIA